jgi:hypothetical protein
MKKSEVLIQSLILFCSVVFVQPALLAEPAASGSVQDFPSKVCAPYVECWGNLSVAALATATGNKFYTLAFIISNSTANSAPYWDGSMPLSDNKYVTDIANLRAQGGDVIISFGGASGMELAQVYTSVGPLQAAYQQVITKYNLKWMDLDIEGAFIADAAAINRRNQALKNLQTASPGLKVSYTLPAMPEGLTQDGLNLLSNAKSNGVQVDIVNVMAMDYGSCNIDMGQAAINAASNTRDQLATLGVSSKIGITPMIGVNDVSCENFTTANTQAVVNYANANSYIGFLGFWAEDADANHDYLNIFKTFSAPVAVAPVMSKGFSFTHQKAGMYDLMGRMTSSLKSTFSVEKSIVLNGSKYVIKIK